MEDIMPNDDEGVPAILPAIPEAARAIGVTEANIAEKFDGALPATHWSHGMKAGEFKIENGAVLEYEPTFKLRQPLFVEAPLKDQPEFDFLAFDGVATNPNEAYKANKALVEWL